MKQPRKIPQRMCVGCREMKDKKELLRIVRTPEGQVEFDPTGKKSGRGAYICRAEGCLQRADKVKALQKALQCDIPADLFEQLT
jgi:predicted RNA-binding protein YlxR (DUF448 family)